jgi:hypothetical protein
MRPASPLHRKRHRATNELLGGFVLGIIGGVFSFLVIAIILDTLIRSG